MSTISEFSDYEGLFERYRQFAHEHSEPAKLTVDICSMCGIKDMCLYNVEHCPIRLWGSD